VERRVKESNLSCVIRQRRVGGGSRKEKFAACSPFSSCSILTVKEEGRKLRKEKGGGKGNAGGTSTIVVDAVSHCCPLSPRLSPHSTAPAGCSTFGLARPNHPPTSLSPPPPPYPILLTLLVWLATGGHSKASSGAAACTLPAPRNAATVRVERMNFMVVWPEVVVCGVRQGSGQGAGEL